MKLFFVPFLALAIHSQIISPGTALALDPGTNRTDFLEFKIHVFPAGGTNELVILTNRNSLLVLEDFQSVKETRLTIAIESVYKTDETSDPVILHVTLARSRPEPPKVTVIHRLDGREQLPVRKRVASIIAQATPPTVTPPLPTEHRAGETYLEAQKRFMESRQGLRRNQ